MSAFEPIAIVGIGCRLPGGVKSPVDLWNLLVAGLDVITEVPIDRWHSFAMYHPDPAAPGRMNSRWGGFLDAIDRFDAQFFGISPREVVGMDPQQRLLLEVAYHAVEDAGLTLSCLARTHASVHIGISAYDYGSVRLDSNDRETIDAYTNLGAALCLAANRISYFFNLTGSSLAVDTACSSSLVATHLACHSIWNGESDLAFVGGVNAILRPEPSIGFSKAAMLSPDGRCKSFDAGANGYVRSEGAVVVILKPLARALADNDSIYACIRATATNQDGRTAGISVPNGKSQKANIMDALRLARMAPESVQYVEAHGTGTPVGDPIEAAAIGQVYGAARSPDEQCLIGSIKSNLGHLEAASGLLGLVKTALCLHHRQIPASLHCEHPNPAIPFRDLRLRVVRQLEPWPKTQEQPQRAAVNSFGFGGTNAHVILEAAPEAEMTAALPDTDADRRAWILPLTARSAPALLELARCYRDELASACGLQAPPLRDICFSAGVKRSHHDFRLTLVAHDKAELTEQIEAFIAGDARPSIATGRKMATSAAPVFVCSGMGQQWWAMGRELLYQEAVYRRTVEEVSDLFEEIAGWSLLEKLTADEHSSEIQQTCFGQPAILATQVALAALLRSWGLEPAAVLGHSAGEMAAAHIAGALSLEDAVLVTFHRSRLQQRTAGQGSMLAVGISQCEAELLVKSHSQSISIAALNAPKSITLSGSASVLAQISAQLNAAGFFSRTLQVDVPFHSPIMDELQPELAESLRDLRPRPAKIRFFSTVTGSALAGPELDASYWCRNIREPVLFRDALREAMQAGNSIFLEIGAHPVLRNDIAACQKANSTDGVTLSSLLRERPERASLLRSLGTLFCRGAEIEWHRLFPSASRANKLPLYPFQRESYWRESNRARQTRLGLVVHPLLGSRYEAPQPSWKVELNAPYLLYLRDHRVGASMVFPAAGYIEMALGAARETLGPAPYVLEEVEFRELLFLDEKQLRVAHVTFDREANRFAIYAAPDASNNEAQLHACGAVRQASPPRPDKMEFAQLRARCSDTIDPKRYYDLLAELGFNYGPAFRALTQLWRGNNEVVGKICASNEVSDQFSEYRLHPVLLDACLQLAVAAFGSSRATSGKSYIPVKVERFIFYATPPGTRFFGHAKITKFGMQELTADIKLFDEAGNCLAAVHGFIARSTGEGMPKAHNALYEYQWSLAPRAASGAMRTAHEVLPPAPLLIPIIVEAGKALRKRLNRHRFQNEFRSLARANAAVYVVHALRELGWTDQCATMPIERVAEQLRVAPQYYGWLQLMLKELTPAELAATEEPRRLRRAWLDQFPECLAEALLGRLVGESLPAVLRGDIDPLHLIFPEGALNTAEHLYQDSPSYRLSNLLVQKAVLETVRSLPKGKRLRILEIGGGTGGLTSYLLPILPGHCTEYVFTDISPRFTMHAGHNFARFPFVQCRLLDMERDPIEQGFEPHSFDIIVASDVLHATKALRSTLARIKQLLGSGGMLVATELTREWLGTTFIFGLLKGWWLFEDHDLRPDNPLLSPRHWECLLRETEFTDVAIISDCPDTNDAQHSVLVARGPQLAAANPLPCEAAEVSGTWLLFVDDGTPSRLSAGAILASALRMRGGRVIQVTHGAQFQRRDGPAFVVRAGSTEDMSRLMEDVHQEARSLAGIVHLWSLDIESSEASTGDALRACATLGCIGVLQLVQAMVPIEGLVVREVWLITRSTQCIGGRDEALEVVQSPLWGLSRVAANEYHNVRWRLVDLASCSREEIESLAAELTARDDNEDEIALDGELRYVHRLVPVSPATMHGMGLPATVAAQPFRIELHQPGILDSLSARPLTRIAPVSHEVEIEVVATGLNFKDLMHALAMLPVDAADEQRGKLLGLECAGRVVAVGDEVSEFSVGDEVVAVARRSLASHVTVDARFVARKPAHLDFEQAATIPIAFVTAFYSLHTLGRLQHAERVLIHSAAGGVGLAAVQLALQAGAVVFATAGSPEKRELLSAFGVPHVMDSRNLDFVEEVLEQTNGDGLDMVLNSLAGEAIEKNLSILRPFGRYVEIGLIDIHKNRRIGMRPLRENISLFAVDLSRLFEQRPELSGSLLREVMDYFEKNELHPLTHRVFPAARVVDAFRGMAHAKHVGKLIVSMEQCEGLVVEEARQAISIGSDGSYLVTGGLGGLGLAVAERLIRHGARRLALVGRSTPSSEAQVAVEALQEKGAEIKVCHADIADREQTAAVLADIQRTIGPLRGIIHAATIWDDAPVEQQTEERMWKSMAPKIIGAWNLHTATADMPLDLFVLFSSFASITGNRGQASYAAGNAFLDALAYYRRSRGLPCLTINWGRVGGAGRAAADQETAQRLDRLSVRPIPLSEALDAFDTLIVSNSVQVGVAQVDWNDYFRSTFSRIPARFTALATESGAQAGRVTLDTNVRDIIEADAVALPLLLETYLRDQLARALGTMPARIDLEQPLLNLGIDSLIAVEVRNRIHADFGINVPLAKLIESVSLKALAAQLALQLNGQGPRQLHIEALNADVTGAQLTERLPKQMSLSAAELPTAPHAQSVAAGAAAEFTAPLLRKKSAPLLDLIQAGKLEPLAAGALMSWPTTVFEQSAVSPEVFFQRMHGGRVSLDLILETPLGSVGLFMMPLTTSQVKPGETSLLPYALDGIRHASACGAQYVALTGLIPSATNYGAVVHAACANQNDLASVTTGHATTVAAVLLNLSALLREAGRKLEDETVMFYGVGSIGLCALRLMLDVLPHPAAVRLCDPFRSARFFTEVEATLRRDHAYEGSIKVFHARHDNADDFYDAGVIVGATNVENQLDAERLAPGTLVVDDSSPHCMNGRAALTRFAERKDILFTEGGFVRGRAPIPRITHIPPAVAASMPAAFPQLIFDLLNPSDITACILSALLSARRPELPPTIGLVTPAVARQHWTALAELGFSAAELNYEGTALHPEGIATFREYFGRVGGTR